MPFDMSWLPEEVIEQLDGLEREHGAAPLDRVRQMLSDPTDRSHRHPYQRTAKYVLPGLRHNPWYDLESCPTLGPAARGLQSRHSAIKQEFLETVARDETGLNPYVSDLGNAPRIEGWKMLFIYQYGKPVPQNITRYPNTYEAIREFMAPHLYSLAEVHYSLLEPNTHIKPHSDPTNMTLSFHLAVDIPEGCRLRVADDWYRWVEGKCLAFDHSFEHEAMNTSSVRRTSLLMDVWNPGVTAIERQAVSLVFNALHEAFRGG